MCLAAGGPAALLPDAAGGTLAVRADVLREAGSAAAAALLEIPWEGGDCAIFGAAVGWDQTLRPGDRVEVLRPLQADPRVSRRRRAAESRKRIGQPAGAGPASGGR